MHTGVFVLCEYPVASFRTHISVAASASAMGASALIALHLVDVKTAAGLWLLGVFGGILPDIDSDTSRPVMWLFNSLGIGAAALTCWWLTPGPELYLLWIAMAMAYLLFGVALREMFFRCTVHRGVYHSLLAVLFAGLLTTLLAYRVVELPAADSWWAGIFVAGGYLVHLLLDECYSVDFNGMRLKSSFGTAIKPLSIANWPGSLFLALGCLTLLHFGPELSSLGVVVPGWSGNGVWQTLVGSISDIRQLLSGV